MGGPLAGFGIVSAGVRRPSVLDRDQIPDVAASPEAVAWIRNRGGRLYVWVRRGSCCGAGTRTLRAAHEPPGGIEFRRVSTCGEFELFLPAGLGELPQTLEIEYRRFPERIEAFWNGCAWVV